MIFQVLINLSLLASIISMLQFAKYCRLLNRRLDQETAERCQARARRWLAAVGCTIITAIASLFLGAIFP